MNDIATIAKAPQSLLMQSAFPWHTVAPLYQEPHRAYHSMSHIHSMLQEISRATVSEDEKSWLMAVAWLHDAYHDPLAKPPYNEEMSAAMLDGVLGDAFTDFGKTLAREAILASALHFHDQEYLHPLVFLFLDIDIAGLSADDWDFNRQTRAVAEEFRRAGRSTEKIADSHALFCKKMLARNCLYYTGQDALERDAKARMNLRRVIDEPLYFV